jgi:hypothetical protein
VTTGSQLLRTACPLLWYVRLTATVTGAAANVVVAVWIAAPGNPVSLTMTKGAGGTWSAVAALPAGRTVVWTATAVTLDGLRVVSARATLRYDCVG